MKEYRIHGASVVKSYRYGNNLEITTSSGVHRQVIKVLPEKKYKNLITGKIYSMNNVAKTREDNQKALRRTMSRLRRLIAHNFQGGFSELWVTLTYSEITLNPDIVYMDFKLFIKRLRKLYPKLEYINVIEPQASGSWHCHVLLKTRDNSHLYIPNKVLADAWKKGFTKTKRLKRNDKVGNYLVAYLSNLEVDSKQNGKNKKVIKGARLYLYPKGVRIYRCSRGIQRPIEQTGFKADIMKNNGLPVTTEASYTKTTSHIIDYNTEITYVTEYFNGIGETDENSES
ncbi:hypothetical protein SAMN02910293_00227 [Streptococcus henryi]|uniref:Replication-associated protein ORF2/G2P domain-containing protein n=1 Tax=Streptococcus henryi TaxID=439219 RepID=A0A1G6A853_9STRE|nr:replicative protein [Streptococcus henryi]SDB04585.1 hypothetical protein SAMN02910293_00227 [Streptococcus henryi]